MMQDHGHHSSRKALATSPEVAMASEVFDLFCNATTLKTILGHFRHLCDLLNMRPNTFPQFYPKFKSKLRSWKAQALWKKFDQRANHKCYNRGKACSNTRVLIIGGGPCGLRSAIEAQLLGAKVVVVEKRDRMSRNNVLHLWPFVIHDLRGLGAKKFFGKFCAGSIDHISIRQLQCILLKVALILGVEFHEGVSFDSLILPPDNQEEGKIGWRAKTTPPDHPVSQYEFDVLIGADGKRNTLEGFKRKEFRGKLAIAITANFINKRTEAEARVEEISGVAFIFNQKFFKELYQETGIDLENIVYYKDDTHYFVMTAKKHSLIDKGVILQDHADTAKLLAKENVDRDALMLYAREAAEFSTQYQMMDMEFAVNHYGQPDVAMFDFTSMYAAENASRVLERFGHRLLMILVGDSLLEPFWPTGSGCARGFLSSMDAGWAIKGWGGPLSPLEVLAERESIYRLLGQTTPENLNRDYAAYTLDPHTRYPNLNVRSVSTSQVLGLLDTDDPDNIKQPSVQSTDIPKKRRRRDTQIHPDTLLHWLQRQVALYDKVQITDLTTSFKDGLATCAIIHRYRPDLVDFHSLKTDEVEKNNQLAFDVLEKELGISPIMTGEEMARCDVPDKLAMFSYLTQLYEAFRGEIPHIKHPKLEPEDDRSMYDKQLSQLTPGHKVQIGRLTKHETPTRPRHSRSLRHNIENVQTMLDKKIEGSLGRKSRKRRSNEKMGATVEERQKRLADIVNNRIERMKRRQFLRQMATQQFYKSLQMLQANAKREKDEPFEDYSIFLYRQTAPDFKDRVKELEQKILYPDRDPKMPLHHKGNMDEDFSGRIKDIEDKLRGTAPTEKKPRDLLRAIGKIEKTDWNVKEIEKKIEENKMGKGVRQDKVERVPKWSREQFLARQIKMEKKGKDPNEPERKYAEIDSTLKNIDRKIKEGNVLGHNKVSAMAEQFANKNQDNEPKVQRSNSKAAIVLPTQGGSEMCHFCDKRVYLMERLSAEGKSFHRGCFRCEYCSTSLRIGNHTFDREKNGGRFYCTQHFGLPGTMKTRIEKKKLPLLNKENIPEPTEKKKPIQEKTQAMKPALDGVVGLDLLDRGQTPERIEFENLAGVSDTEEAHSQMDEDEWTDRNFGASAAEMGSSDDISDMSDSDDDNEIYEEAIDQPLTTEGTIELAKNWTLRYSHPQASAGHSDTGSNEYEDSSDEYTSEDEESGTATEDEEDVRARELRKQEVWLKVPPRESDTETGSETEVASDEESSEERQENSATEISTDSEFEHDGTTPTQNEPEISINDNFVRKTRGQYIEPKKVQVKSRIITPVNGKVKPGDKRENETTSKINNPKVNDSSIRPIKAVNAMPLVNPRKGDYLLNRTHSTEGIASKLSLELKRRYLLGGSVLGGNVIKSGSTSNVDTKLRNFTDTISQHQKLLNPAPEPSPTMQAFLQGTNKLRSTSNIPLSPILSREILPVSPLRINKSSEIEKPKEPVIDYVKVHLPDLVKETNIMKSKTDSNILRLGILRTPDTKNENEKKIESNIEEEVVNKSEQSKEELESKRLIGIKENEVNKGNTETHLNSKHEASISQQNWNKNKIREKKSSKEFEMDSDSLSSDSDTEVSENDEDENEVAKIKEKETEQQNILENSSKLRVHNTDEALILDERNNFKEEDLGMTFEPDSIECILNMKEDEKNVKNIQPLRPVDLWVRQSNDDTKNKEVEAVKNDLMRLDLKENVASVSNCSSPSSVASTISNKQNDSVENDITTAALTETEFSEWARDGDGFGSADLKDAEFDMSSRTTSSKKLRGNAKIAKEEDLTDIESTSEQVFGNNNNIILENDTSKLLVNGEDIDYMDTDNESLLDSLRDATNVPLVKNRGFVEFVNIPGMSTLNSKESKSSFNDAPIARIEIEQELCLDEEKYETYDDENIIQINLVTMDDVKERLSNCSIKAEHQESETNKASIEAVNRDVIQSMDEDSLLVVETAEDTTTSELTTILASPVCPLPQTEPEKVEECSSKTEVNDVNNPDYLEYVKRLQSRIAEFSNAKDSIDVRKSKRKNSKNTLQEKSAEMISEEIKSQEAANIGFNSPATSRKLEEITRERSKQKNLIQDLLMDKLEAQKQKSAEKKAKRAARNTSFNSSIQSFSPKPPPNLPPEASIHDMPLIPSKNPIRTTFAEAKKSLDPPVVTEKRPENKLSPEKSNNDLQKVLMPSIDCGLSDFIESEEKFKTPVAPPRSKHEEARKTAEKAKQEARERARLMSDEDLGLSPEDKIRQLRMKVARRQLSMEDRQNHDNDITPDIKTRHYSFTAQKSGYSLQPSKSTDNMKAFTKKTPVELLPASSAKSMSELVCNKDSEGKSPLDMVVKRDKKKPKDPERRRSIIQAVSDFFKKKESTPSPSHKDKGSVFRLTTRSKDKGKLDKIDTKFEERPKSVCEPMLIENFRVNSSPPVPPPPLNYPDTSVHVSDDSLSDDDSKMTTFLPSQIQKHINIDGHCTNSSSRKMKNTKKMVRQAQLKRLRIAQEIQRKLEETEVKQRDLESRGVSVEKALRGEGECSGREETDLLGEWFDLMRERTELRRYEKELLVRAQEVQLEDRHDRLQQELRERLADDDQKKTSADVKKEGEILTEMLEIVAKRDSLIALLEEERQRYKNEDKDIEAQMLAKGLRLTSIDKDDSKYLV